MTKREQNRMAKEIAKIARETLRLETLEARNSDRLDFHEQAVWSIKDALVAAYRAGQNATKTPPAATTEDRLDTLRITKMEKRAHGGEGTWVCGTIAGYKFSALVFPEHAENPEYEIADSKISKLWIKRLADQKTVFNWDRGADVQAENDTVQAIVDDLCAGLAEHTFAR
ncbi:MAG TPA: hypothetical protein VGP72_31635 [Planctomycetota bacterium]|jgi:hypothetical protein